MESDIFGKASVYGQHSHIWDVTSVAMLDSAVEKFQKNGIQVTVRGLNEASSIMIEQYGTHAKV